MDLNHGMPFTFPTKISVGNYQDCKDSAIIIITAGANQKPGESRIDLTHKNTRIFAEIIENIKQYCQNSIILVVTNPVDILSYVTYKLSGFPKNRVIGSGTVLDSARFRYLIGNHVNIDPRNVNACIIGEHGDTEVAAWSLTNLAGMSMEQFCEKCGMCGGQSRQQIFEDVRTAAYKIIERKGATYYAVALAVRRIVEAIIRNENAVLTVSTLLEGQYGLNNVYLSLPCIVNSNGVQTILCSDLKKAEEEAFYKSGQSLIEIIQTLDI
jgi:L-lactate dehydrogenase